MGNKEQGEDSVVEGQPGDGLPLVGEWPKLQMRTCLGFIVYDAELAKPVGKDLDHRHWPLLDLYTLHALSVPMFKSLPVLRTHPASWTSP